MAKCVDIAMQHHVRYLSDAVTAARCINYEAFSEFGKARVFEGFRETNLRDAAEDFKTADAQLQNNTEFFARIRKHTWTMFLANIDSHWVAIIMHVTPTLNDRSDAVIKRVIIADPERRRRVDSFVWTRLHDIFTGRRRFTWAATCTASQPLWYPRQEDYFSCGLRSYQIMKTMLLRINEQFLIDNQSGGFHPSLWDPLSRDMVPGKQFGSSSSALLIHKYSLFHS